MTESRPAPSDVKTTSGDPSQDRGHREREARFRTTVELAPVGIGHFDLTGRFVFVNPQLGAMFGLSETELLARTFQDVTCPEDLPHCLDMTGRLAAGSIPSYALEKRFIRPGGSTIYARAIVSAVRLPSGQVDYFIGVVEDLSEQWVVEQARRDAEARLRLALDASGTGIYRYDFRTEALDWSNNLGSVFGFAGGDELKALPQLLAAIHPDDLGRVVAAYERSAMAGLDFNEDFRIVRPDGAVRWISDRARMTLDEQGAARHLTGACVDITTLREFELERTESLEREREARVEAERAITLRDEVLTIVAHDLRNPVHTIMMSSGAMLELDLPDSAKRQQLSVILRSARTMEQLIRDLLDVTRIESGRLAIERARVEVAPLLSEVRDSFSRIAKEQGIALDVGVEAEVGDVFADRDRMTQVLSNLVGNALKFTPREGRVAIGARKSADFVELTVADTGRGIPPDQLPRIFDRFWQADRAATHGVGLGLTIVRGIVEAHGGRTDAESIVGVGTTFRVRLPVSAADTGGALA